MIEGGQSFVVAAYALTGVLLGGMALLVFLRARHWARFARKDKK